MAASSRAFECARRAAESGLRVTGFQVLRDFEGLSGHLHAYKVDVAKAMLRMCRALGSEVLLACSSTSAHAAGDPELLIKDLQKLAMLAVPLNIRIAQLDAKGLTVADRQNADLYVGYGMVDKTHTDVYTYRDGWGWGGGWGWRYWRYGVAWPMTVQHQIETYTDGTVVVHLIDAKTKQVVWQGEIADVVNLPVENPVQATQQIDAAVSKLFAKYPPQSSGARG